MSSSPDGQIPTARSPRSVSRETMTAGSGSEPKRVIVPVTYPESMSRTAAFVT